MKRSEYRYSLFMLCLLAALDGLQVPGGCDHCDAYQTVHAHADGPDLHRITVHHDDWCPWWAQRSGAGSGVTQFGQSR